MEGGTSWQSHLAQGPQGGHRAQGRPFHRADLALDVIHSVLHGTVFLPQPPLSPRLICTSEEAWRAESIVQPGWVSEKFVERPAEPRAPVGTEGRGDQQQSSLVADVPLHPASWADVNLSLPAATTPLPARGAAVLGGGAFLFLEGPCYILMALSLPGCCPLFFLPLLPLPPQGRV